MDMYKHREITCIMCSINRGKRVYLKSKYLSSLAKANSSGRLKGEVTPLTFSSSTKLQVQYMKLKLRREQIHNLSSIHSLHLHIGSPKLYSALRRKGPFFQTNGGTHSSTCASCCPCVVVGTMPRPNINQVQGYLSF